MSFKTKIGRARVLTRRIGRSAEETQSVSKGRFGSAEPKWCASIRAALVAAAICAATAPSPLFAETPDAFLEYVESTGTQFVDIEIIGRTGTKIEADFWGLAPGSACLLGSHSTG